MSDAIHALMRPLRRAVANLVARAVVELVSDSSKLQAVQLSVLEGELRDGCERFQEYGFTSVPKPGAEAVVLFPSGLRDHALVIAVDDRRYRLRGLASGEVALYTDEGDRIVIQRGGTIDVHAATALTISAPTVTISGNLAVNGPTGITVPNGDVQAGSVKLKTHKHQGVTAGGAQTGTPV